jgi:hypothetical protein
VQYAGATCHRASVVIAQRNVEPLRYQGDTQNNLLNGQEENAQSIRLENYNVKFVSDGTHRFVPTQYRRMD